MRRIEPYLLLYHGVPRIDDHLVLSGIIFVVRNGLRYHDAPREYGRHKMIYNGFVRCSTLGVFNRILPELIAKRGKQLMIDATHCPSHRGQSAKRGDVSRRIGRTDGTLNS